MTLYTAEPLDLSRLDTAPLVTVDAEATRLQMLGVLQSLWDEARVKDPTLPPLEVLGLRANPAALLNNEFAYGLTLVKEAINDAADSLRLARAVNGALDHLTASYHRTQRQIIVPATETTPAVYETDAELRARAQLAPEALADLALTPGGYIYKVRTAFADRIKDVRPIRRGGGHIELRLLGRSGDGAVDDATVAEVLRAFEPEGMTQSTDILSVFSAEIVPIAPRLTLVFGRGPDPQVVAAAARASLATYAASLHRIGTTVYREAIASAAHVSPVITVRVEEPAADIAGDIVKAPYIDPSAITIETEIV
ncbi:baseplate J/gp47 family protein [Aurantimonas sp. VKM B-3413]|uniref:baseplate J/gp47 family protein n=1 Tax=Aurantimonas sp. VKM B-3413 TaxID=2779401 RepID=UPI001E570D3B|nr:baseplate J/gp47 family protein [Aurantimonas sp. VKM B-3413]MCB8835937.1 baseplate J/gp47 family protein [Aurantimonas sp. VKM B-3413]